MNRPRHVPAIVKWLLLVAATAWLLTWVDPSFVESPYNGF